MSVINSITEDSSVKALVESVRTSVSRIAHQYYRPGWSISHEDLLDVGMEEVVKAAVKNLPRTKFPRSRKKAYQRKRAYLLVAARRAIIRQYRDGAADLLKRPSKMCFSPVLSLDGETTSLYDEVAAPNLFSTPSSEDRDFSLLYEVLDSLPDHYREVVCMRFGLCGYGVHRPCEMARLLEVSRGAIRGRLRRALSELRKHTELLTLVGGHGGRGDHGVLVAAGEAEEE